MSSLFSWVSIEHVLERTGWRMSLSWNFSSGKGWGKGGFNAWGWGIGAAESEVLGRVSILGPHLHMS